MSVTISPQIHLQFFTASGVVATGYQLFTYQAGTSIKQATWTDSTQSTQNANPLKLDSQGRAYVWPDPTLVYKYVLALPTDTDPPQSPVETVDNIQSPINLSNITQALIGTTLYPRTAAESAAGVTPTNYAYPPEDIRRYGGSSGASGAVNRTALLNALAVAAGSDYGYQMPAYEILLADGGTYNIASGGDIVMPVNVTLRGPATLLGTTIALSGTDRLILRNPASQGGAHTYTQYWPYFSNGMKNIAINGGGGILINNYIGAVFEDCDFSSPVELRNSYALWTERTGFTRCVFGASSGDAILFNGTLSQANPGIADGSFAYTTFGDCVVAVSGSANLVHLKDGASAYGSKWQFRGNFTSSGAMFYSDGALNGCKLNEGTWDVRVESGNGTSTLFNISGGEFWSNKGNISLPSYDFAVSEGGGVSLRYNQLMITGATWKHPYDATITMANGTQVPTWAVSSVVQRLPVNMRSVDFWISGTMTSAANTGAIQPLQVLGVLPTKGTLGMQRLLRVEFNFRVGGGTPTPNPDTKWYIDFRKDVFSTDTNIANLKKFWISDQNNANLQSFNVDLDLTASPFDSSWTDIVVEALPTDAAYGSKNTGTGPTDVRCRITGFY